MKLCPQCDFIYEDDQLFCDMDGRELVHNFAPIGTEQGVVRPTRITIDLPAKSHSRRSRSLIFAGVALTALLSVIYVAQLRPSVSNTDRFASQSSTGSTSHDARLQPSVSAAESPSPIFNAALSEPPSLKAGDAGDDSTLSRTQALASRAALAGDRLAANPIAARATSSNSRGPVIVRLNNGSSIKADEAWETREGVWYRQAGMVTLLKRSQVRTIEGRARPKSVAKSDDEKNRTAAQAANRDRRHPARLEPPETTRQSRVASFLKKTGRFLKRPFKF